MSQIRGLNRRQFLRNSALGLVGAGISSQGIRLRAEEQEKPESPKIKEYRTLGRTGFKVSDISSGAPMEPAILSALLDAGVNYIDTAEAYGNGQSERVVGEIMKDRDRKSVFITTKMQIGRKTKKEQVLKRARKSLERLQMDYVDCFMIHGPDHTEIVKAPGFHEAMTELKAEGRVKHCGLSNHGYQYSDKVEPTEKVIGAAVEDGRFDVFLMVYNFIQKDSGETLLNMCREKNIGTTLMKTNPVGGYTMIKESMEALEKEGKDIPPVYKIILPRFKLKADRAQEFIKKHNLQNNSQIREAAIRFVLSNPDVNAVCISFRNFDDVENHIKLSGMRMTAEDREMLAAYREGCGPFYCRHACGRCEPRCPYGVPVNTIMRYTHYFGAQGREKYAMLEYAKLKTAKADLCQDCEGHCESACPYGVPIHGLLLLAHQTLTLA